MANLSEINHHTIEQRGPIAVDWDAQLMECVTKHMRKRLGTLVVVPSRHPFTDNGAVFGSRQAGREPDDGGTHVFGIAPTEAVTLSKI